MEIPNNAQKHCLSINCPERRRICCHDKSKAVTGDEGTGHFECSQCGKEFIANECTAWDEEDTVTDDWESEFDRTFPDLAICNIHILYVGNKVKSFIRTLIDQKQKEAREEEVIKFKDEIQKRAESTRPNLLLNEVVNYAHDRCKSITLK